MISPTFAQRRIFQQAPWSRFQGEIQAYSLDAGSGKSLPYVRATLAPGIMIVMLRLTVYQKEDQQDHAGQQGDNTKYY